MTANLKRFDPAGSDGATATATGNLTSVIVGGAGTVAYEADYGMARGSNMGLRAVAPGTADQANIKVTTTAAATGSGQVYGGFENWHSGAADQEFMTLRTGAGNCIRFVVTTAGVIKVQNQAGSPVATLGSVSLLPTRYRWELEAVPGTTTSNGSGRARVYDDDDNLVYDSGPLTAGNYGGGLATKTVSELRVGDPATATTSGFAFGFTQPAIDTDATTPPTIAPVAKGIAATVSVPATTLSVDTPAPVVTGSRAALVLATAASLLVTALAPTVVADLAVSGGGPIALTVTALAPSVTGARAPLTVVPAATFTLAAPAPVVTLSRAVAVAVDPVPIIVTALAPSVPMGTPAQVQVPQATITVPAPAPLVTGQRAASVQLDTVTVTVSAVAPVVIGQRVANVQASAAALSVEAPTPVVTGQRSGAVVLGSAAIHLVAHVPIITTIQPDTPTYRTIGPRAGSRAVRGGGNRTIRSMKRRQ